MFAVKAESKRGVTYSKINNKCQAKQKKINTVKINVKQCIYHIFHWNLCSKCSFNSFHLNVCCICFSEEGTCDRLIRLIPTPF